MPRLIDFVCACGHREPNAVVEPDSTRPCPVCNQTMHEDWLPRVRKPAQWLDPVVVFVSQDPEKIKAGVDVRYPMRNDRPTPAGYERVEIRSDHEMGRFERSHKVLNHSRWFDQNGRGFDDNYRGQRDGWEH